MRKEKKTLTINPEIARVQRYHEGGSYHDEEAYAYRGFARNLYFTSDRTIVLDESFQRPDGKPLQGYGLEIETECMSIRDNTVYAELLDKVVFSHFPADMFKLQRDGSLGGASSAECITQVLTQERIRNLYPSFKAMYDTYFPAFQVSCAATGNCGMHVNISNACFGRTKAIQDESIRKLLYVVNRHYDVMCSMLRRDHSRTGYCRLMYVYLSKASCLSANLSNFDTDHGVCFNLGHYDAGRVELRLVGGQKNFASFRNTMETVFFLVSNLRKLRWEDLDNLGTLFEGCNQYVYDRLTLAARENPTLISSDVLDRVKACVKREELI